MVGLTAFFFTLLRRNSSNLNVSLTHFRGLDIAELKKEDMPSIPRTSRASSA